MNQSILMTLMLSSNEFDVWKFLYPGKYAGPCINISVATNGTEQYAANYVWFCALQTSNVPSISEGLNLSNSTPRISWKQRNKQEATGHLQEEQWVNDGWVQVILGWNREMGINWPKKISFFFFFFNVLWKYSN